MRKVRSCGASGRTVPASSVKTPWKLIVRGICVSQVCVCLTGGEQSRTPSAEMLALHAPETVAQIQSCATPAAFVTAPTVLPECGCEGQKEMEQEPKSTMTMEFAMVFAAASRTVTWKHVPPSGDTVTSGG